MSRGYSLLLDVTGRRAVVVGGGPVAARRARGLVEAGAAVEVLAPAICEDIADLVQAGSVRLHLREYEDGDLAGAWLVHTATGDREVDSAVAAAADTARVWCVRADDASASSAWTPAVARVDGTVVAVSTDRDPLRARGVRDAVQDLLEAGRLPMRRRRLGTGRVSLVGGGPGEPGLITTRGRQLLAAADVVVVDRLAPRALLDELEADVEVIDAGKAPGNHPMPQEEINRVVVAHALAGRHVVRLKGGDPYVLGRGGEEVLACHDAGVAVEVVPGVTSAAAVPAAAGIPLTHRGIARSFTVVSAHDDVDWATLAAIEGTLVLLMGVASLGPAAAELVRQGRAATTPVAVVERGTMPDQRTTVGTLETIEAQARDQQVTSPAVIVVGDVVGLAPLLAPPGR